MNLRLESQRLWLFHALTIIKSLNKLGKRKKKKKQRPQEYILTNRATKHNLTNLFLVKSQSQKDIN